MRVVDDDSHVVGAGRHHLEPARDVLQRGNTLLDRAERNIKRHRGRDGGENVVGIRPTHEWRCESERAAGRPYVEAQSLD